MAFPGGIKFFEKNKGLKKDGASGAASSGSNSVDNAIDRNAHTVWRSVGSDDTTTETYTLTLGSAIDIDSILLLGHNWKQFTVKYNTSSDFTNVIGLDGALGGGISETAFADNSAFYSFTPVTGVNTIDITVTKTHVVDDEKYISQIAPTELIGTLDGWPIINPVKLDRNIRLHNMLSGRKNAVKSIETFSFGLQLSTYPSDYTADLALLYSLVDKETPFLVWLCGGNRSSPYFNQTLRGFRLQDAIPMQIVNAPDQSYTNNWYAGPIDMDFDFVEVTV